MKKKKTNFFKPGLFAAPYIVICLIFVVLPLILVLVYAFIGSDGSFTFDNFKRVFVGQEQTIYGIVNENGTMQSGSITVTIPSGNVELLLKTLGIAALTTAVCLLIAYPVALVLASSPFNKYFVLSLLFIIPMWMNFVLRIIALKSLLYVLGISEGLFSVIVGMVYDFLPFMMLPIYTVLTEIDKSYFEASADLGANKFTTFFKVTLPLSAGGIMSGITMVFMPVFSAYAITNMLGDSSTTVIGNKINTLFGLSSSWGVGSALSFVLLVLVLLTMGLSSLIGRKTQKTAPVKKGGKA